MKILLFLIIVLIVLFSGTAFGDVDRLKQKQMVPARVNIKSPVPQQQDQDDQKREINHIDNNRIDQGVLPSVMDVLDHHSKSDAFSNPSSKKDRLNQKQNQISNQKANQGQAKGQSHTIGPIEKYEQQMIKELENERPSINEVNVRRHKGEYMHTNGEQEEARAICGDNKDCEIDAIQWAAAPPDPKTTIDKKEKEEKKAKRDKQVETAVKKGETRAKKELDKVGGPDPYGGMFIGKDYEKEKKNAEELSQINKEEKGTKTLKGSKGSKTTIATTESPTVAAGEGE